jgi:NADH-quinone oxidoreductase subunit F
MDTWRDRMNLVVFEPLALEQPWKLETYRKIGGYDAGSGSSREKIPREQVIEQVKASGLRGRGGAGFPTGTKWSFMPRHSPIQKYASAIPTRVRARHLPRPRHPALQPALADRGHGDRRLRDGRDGRLQLHPRRVPRRARAALRGGAPGSLRGRPARQESCGSGVDFDLQTVVGAGAYICGEETALLESLEGKQGKPRFKPPFPAASASTARPTTINNTQSYASVPTILRKGRSGSPSSAPELRRHGDLLGVRPRREARQLRAAARHSVQGPARDRRRHEGRPCAEGVIPGGSSVPVVPGE